MPDRARTRELAAEFIRKGEPLEWFEALYQEAERGDGLVPWADREPNRRLIDYWQRHPIPAAGKNALVIGCGLGDDAQQLAAWGFKTTAFDISRTAIEGAVRRYPATHVEYVVANLFDPPLVWHKGFDFVLEVYTVQALPAELRAKAVEKIGQFVKPRGGQLLVIARGRAKYEPEGEGPPWPLTPDEIAGFQRGGLDEMSFEDFAEPGPSSVRRFCALYRRP